jgi:hypothetical protein
MFLWCERETFLKEKTKVNIIGKQNFSWKFKMMRQLGGIFFGWDDSSKIILRVKSCRLGETD